MVQHRLFRLCFKARRLQVFKVKQEKSNLEQDKDTRNILNTLFRLFDISDTTGVDCRKALSSEITDYEDAIMIETAIRSGMDCIVTRNLKDYRNTPIPVYHPADFIKQLETANK